MTECLQAPVRQELRFLLLARDEAHDVLIEARRQRVRIDIRDEAVPIALREQLVDGGFHGFGFTAHVAAFARPMYLSSRSIGMVGVLLSKPASCASDTSLSERRIAKLRRCQVGPTEQVCSIPHCPLPAEHTVSAIGPSSASRIAAALMLSGSRASW